MTTAKKHLCSILDKKLKGLLSKKEGVNAKEFQEIIRLDYIMTDKNLCGVKEKESELSKIERLRKRLKI